MKFAGLDLDKTYTTYADYFSWKFDERVELIKGKIFKMGPAPDRAHQKLAGYIYNRFSSALENRSCEVYVAPFDVRIPRKSKDDKEVITVLQPDICVICNLVKLDKRACTGAPDIAVEVLSPGNNAKELRNKYEIYEEAGVKEYWVVYLDAKLMDRTVTHQINYEEPTFFTFRVNGTYCLKMCGLPTGSMSTSLYG